MKKGQLRINLLFFFDNFQPIKVQFSNYVFKQPTIKHLAEGVVKVQVSVLYPLLQQIQRLQQNQYGLMLVQDDKTVARDADRGAQLTKCFFSEFKRSGTIYLPLTKTLKYFITSTASANVKQLPLYLTQEQQCFQLLVVGFYKFWNTA